MKFIEPEALLKKRLAPFGRELEKQLATGMKPRNDIFFCLGKHAWEKAKHFANTHAVLVLPPNESPYDYEWPVAGCSVLIFGTSPLPISYIEATAYCLLTANAEIVRASLYESSFAVYRRHKKCN